MARIISTHLCIMALLGVANVLPWHQGEAASLKRRSEPDANTIAEYLQGAGKNVCVRHIACLGHVCATLCV